MNKFNTKSMNNKGFLTAGIVVLLVLAAGIYGANAAGFVFPFLANTPLNQLPPFKAENLRQQMNDITKAPGYRYHALKPQNNPNSISNNLPKTSPQPSPKAGIFNTPNGAGGAFPPSVFTPFNAWEGSVGNTWERVYA